MPKKAKQKVSDILSQAQSSLIESDSSSFKKEIPDIITFCNDDQYLGLPSKGISLRMAQRVVLKVFYRGSIGNENIKLTKEEKEWCEKHCIRPEEDNILEKYKTNQSFRELVLVWGRRCLSGSMEVINPYNGKYETIEELYNKNKKTSSYTYDEKLKKMKTVRDVNIIKQGESEVYLLKTNNGWEIEATDNHPFLTESGWVELSNLKRGDSIAQVNGTPFFGNSDKIKENEAAILGYMTADGCCSQSGLFFTCANSNILLKFKKEIGLLSDNLDVIKDVWTKARSKDYQYKIVSKKIKYAKSERGNPVRQKNDLKLLLDRCGVVGTCKQKRVPIELFSCPKRVIASYLRSLFSCDGSLSVMKDGRVYFSFTTVNQSQAQDVQKLLLKFNINARLRRKKVNSKIVNEKGEIKQYKTHCYIVEFSRKKYIETFIEDIGLVGKDDQILNAKKRLLQISNTSTKKELNSEVFFEKIDSITYVGRKTVYDLQVSHKEHEQNFVVSSCITHNSGKDFLAAIIACYEAMRLLECESGNPYEIYKISTASPISILTIATASDQANIAFQEIKDRVINSPYFMSKIGKDGWESQKIYLLTTYDINQNKKLAEKKLPQGKGSVVIEVGHSNSDSLLGKSVFVLILDEVASYKRTGSSSSGERIYTAMSPSLNTFNREETYVDEDGNKSTRKVYDSKIVSISSPRGEDGIFYELFIKAPYTRDRLACRIPTWVCNPNLTEDSLRETNSHMTEEQFMMEFGAEFSGTGGESMFPRKSVESAFQITLANKQIGQPGMVYFAHIDPATSNHNYALVIVHKELFFNESKKENDYRIIVDHIKHWHPTPDSPINSDEVCSYIADLKRRFYIGMMTYDCWNHNKSKLMLKRLGIPSKMTHFSKRYKMIIYTELYDLIIQNKILIPRYDLLKNEMINLQRKWTRPTGFSVFPKTDGEITTDDVVDALAGASFNALDSLARSLPVGRLVNSPMVGSVNSRMWNSMSGPLGYGTGQQVAKRLENLQSWPGS